MSYCLLRDEYIVSSVKNYLWYDFGGAGAISKQYNYLYNKYLGVSNEFTSEWDILEYITKEFNYLWSIGFFVSRGFGYLYDIGIQYGGKIRYSFIKAKSTIRFFRDKRHG